MPRRAADRVAAVTSRPALSRRTALSAAALAPVGLAGCDAGAPSAESPTGATAEPDPDTRLVGSVVGAIARAEAVVIASRAAAPRLARVLDPLAAAHAAHRDLFAQGAPSVPQPTVPDPEVPAGRRAALASVRRVEHRLRGEVELACLEASSGDLARVLAVVAGSLAQHAWVLDQTAADDPGAPR